GFLARCSLIKLGFEPCQPLKDVHEILACLIQSGLWRHGLGWGVWHVPRDWLRWGWLGRRSGAWRLMLGRPGDKFGWVGESRIAGPLEVLRQIVLHELLHGARVRAQRAPVATAPEYTGQFAAGVDHAPAAIALAQERRGHHDLITAVGLKTVLREGG